MKVRILRQDEWGQAPTEEMPALLPYVAPQNLAIIVAESDEGKVIGCLSTLRVMHLEGLWVHPEHRGGMVAYSLYRQALALAGIYDEAWVLGGAADGDGRMDDLIRRCGGCALPLKFYVMPVKGGH
ncbi:MAG: GNAT family N-acetyltransferase [Rhodospirillaceae bacterium]